MCAFFSQIKKALTHSENRAIIRLVGQLKIYLYCWRSRSSQVVDAEYSHLKGKRKCLVLLSADYGNLGDVAITYAQEKFLSEKFLGYEIVDVPIGKTVRHLKSLRKICTKDDIITVTGGGYMGDLYIDAELIRQTVFKVFKDYKVISFPQTADFSETPFGQCMLKQAEKIYGHCRNMELWAREERSYAFMQEYFRNNKVRLTPDIVMSLDETKNGVERSGVTFCLRNDKEKNEKTDSFVSKIRSVVEKQGDAISNYDTHIGDVRLDMKMRMLELTKIWDQFRHSKLVVTDRLHGMIFAYITGSPAIVLPNNNFKVTESYKWIEKCGYIRIVKNMDDVETYVDNLCSMNEKQIKEGFTLTHDCICQVFHSIALFQ